MTEEIPGGRFVGLDCSMGIVGKKFKEFFIGSGNQSRFPLPALIGKRGLPTTRVSRPFPRITPRLLWLFGPTLDVFGRLISPALPPETWRDEVARRQ